MTLIAALSEEQVRQTVEIAYHVLYVRAVISKGHAGAFAAAAYASGYMAVGGAGGTGRQNEGFHGRYQSTQAVNLLFEGADFLVGERGKSGILRFGCDMCGAGHEDSLDITQKGIATFLGEVYSVTNENDRMGCRMDGPVIEHVTDGNIISDGIALGAIQVPTEGKPIIMMADRQTTGGYTKIANVISADFRLLGQLKAGDKVKFEKVSIQEAQQALLNQRAALRTLRRSLDM